MRHLLTVLALLAPLTARADRPAVTVALIVGVNEAPRPALPALRFADDDAVRYYELLSTYAERVELLTMPDAETRRQHRRSAGRAHAATRSNLGVACARLREVVEEASSRGRTTELFVLYAGHGFVDARGDPALALVGGALSRDALAREVIEAVGADRTHLVIDACHAGDFVGARGTWQDDAAPVDHAALVRQYVARGRIDAMPSVGWVVSGSSDQETHEWSVYRAGVFSHQVRSGLLGGADVNLDGRIEYSELGAFLASANAAVDDPRARLAVRLRAPRSAPSAPLMDLRRVASNHVLLLGAPLAGHFTLEDARGVRTADLNKEAGAQMALALPPADFYYIRSDTREARIRPGRERVVMATRLSWTGLQIRGRGSVAEAFRRGLFATSFGPSFYRGHVAATEEVPVDPGARLWFDAPPRDREAVRRNFAHDPPEPPTPRPLRTAGWVTIGGGVAIAAGAAVLGLLTVDARNELDAQVRADGVPSAALERDVDGRGLATAVLMATSVGAAAIGVALVLWGGAGRDGPTPEVALAAAPGGASVWLHGSY